MYKTNLLAYLVFFALSLFLFNCTGKNKSISNSSDMQKLAEKDWQTLSQKRIFFGHQSVGYNIVEGISALKQESQADSFIVKETNDLSEFTHPVFAHSSIGRNQYPKSKIDDFTEILHNGLADSVDIAFMKFCYVDFNRHTNINELFEYYKSAIYSLQRKFPQLVILHCTVPLTSRSGGIKGLAKIILKRDNNVYISKYNELIRNFYKNEVIFDIAKLESTYSDGTTNGYGFGTHCLIPEYTSDGGHLNQKGSILIANGLLQKLLLICYPIK